MNHNKKPANFSPRITALLNEAVSFDNGVVAAAAKALKADQEKEEQQKVYSILSTADSYLKSEVATLKALRAKEKAARQKLKILDSAIAQFTKDGSLEELKKAVGPSYLF